MIRYAAVVNQNIGSVMVGLGDPNDVFEVKLNDDGTKTIVTVAEYYRSIGFVEMEVEQAWDGHWYLAGKAPKQPETRTIRTFSKFAIWGIIGNISHGEGSLWDAFEAFLESSKLDTGTSLKSGWDNLDELVEDNEFYQQFYPKACEVFGKELVDGILEKATTKSRTEFIEEV